MPLRMFGRRRLLVPEVVQTSSMDCGPASLKCMLEGFGISASYGRLREACQTEVDGTSIDTMEEVAVQLGLEVEQVMIPVDHLLIPGSEPLPALVVVRRPPNATHFLVAWRRTGRLLQLMDPATGRRWATVSKFLEEVYVHTMPVGAEGWREWASTPAFTEALAKRLARLGAAARLTRRLIAEAVNGEGWRRLAALDAATRMAESVVGSGGISRGRQAAGVVERFAERAAGEGPDDWTAIPADFWSARPAPPDEDGEEQVLLRGAVLVHVRGRRAGAKSEEVVPSEGGTQLPPELAAALEERPARPGLALLRILRADGLFSPFVLLFAVALAAAGSVAEALMLRGLFDVGRELSLSGQRLGAVVALVVFLLALLLLELPVVSAVLRMGRRLETRLRMLFMDKIPRLGDRYFHSRLTSDMTERSHQIHVLRQLPALGEHFLRAVFSLVLTTLGIAWLDPASAPLAVAAAALAVAVPVAAQPFLVERNLRVRNHAGALSRFYFDALIGLFAVRAHGAERAVRREHENLLIDWAGAGLGLLRATVAAEALHLVAGFGLAAWMLVGYVARAGESGGLLLFAYWVLNLPVLGQEVGQVARQYPGFRNATLRMLEPLGALEEAEVDERADARINASAKTDEEVSLGIDVTDAHVTAQPELVTQTVAVSNVQVEEFALAAETLTLDSSTGTGKSNGDGHAPRVTSRGLSLVFEDVTVRAAGHTILEEISLTIGAGEHVAVVGSSGAGKSSLVGILLGWHRPAAGRVYVGGEALAGRRLEQLRGETAWVDPTVHLWNQTFIENLRYGSDASAADSISRAVKLADLIDVLEKLPRGLQTPLGEGGALVSGGQGQRVRLGRAMLREGARLVILDEPFRGLERERRRRLLERAKDYWRGATLLCITHDVGETLSFERVVVVDGGRVVEDGHPARLAADAGSRYAALLEAEEQVRKGMWSGGEWRRIRLQGQSLREGDAGAV